MKILSFCLKITFLAAIAVLSMTSCKKDEPTPETATISGTILIDHADLWATWKDSGTVELVIFGEYRLDPFPGSGWGVVPADYYSPGSLDGRYALGAPFNAQNPFVIPYSPGIDGFNYTITLDPGTYSALALGFRHNRIQDPNLKTATLGVYWDHPNEVSHGILLKADVGGGNIVTLFDDPAPTTLTLKKGDDVTLDFKVDFDFVNQWYH